MTFIQIKNHYKTDYVIHANLFTVQTRTENLIKMYENAAKTPVTAIDEMDEILGNRERCSSDAFKCTPIIGQIRRRMKNSIDIEIETCMVNLKQSRCINIYNSSSSYAEMILPLKLIKDSSALLAQICSRSNISKSLFVTLMYAIIDYHETR